MNRRRLLRVLARARASSPNISFNDMVALVEAFGFHLARISGSHHIFTRPDVVEQVNLQESNGRAKVYQIRQFLQLVDQYKLEL